MNGILRSLGISFLYLKEALIDVDEALIFARITPGWNFTWPNPTPAKSHEPHMLDFSGIESIIREIGQHSSSEQGISQYIDNKLQQMALEL